LFDRQFELDVLKTQISCMQKEKEDTVCSRVVMKLVFFKVSSAWKAWREHVRLQILMEKLASRMLRTTLFKSMNAWKKKTKSNKRMQQKSLSSLLSGWLRFVKQQQYTCKLLARVLLNKCKTMLKYGWCSWIKYNRKAVDAYHQQHKDALVKEHLEHKDALVKEHLKNVHFYESMLHPSRLGKSGQGVDETVVQIEGMINKAFKIHDAKMHVYNSEQMERYVVQEESVYDKDIESVPTKLFTRVYSGLSMSDPIGASLIQSAQDPNFQWLCADDYQNFSSEYDSSLCIPVRSHAGFNDVIAVLYLHEKAIQNSVATRKRLVTFCRQVSGPLELVQGIETNQILAMRRFTGRTNLKRIETVFQTWKRKHQDVKRNKRVWAERNGYRVLCRWYSLVWKQYQHQDFDEGSTGTSKVEITPELN
jgi:hypothetical protein